MSKQLQHLLAVLIPIAAVSACLYMVSVRGESATDRARRICATCGLERTEVDVLIKTMTEGGLIRAESLERFRQTFDDPEAVGCIECSDAVLVAAGVK